MMNDDDGGKISELYFFPMNALNCDIGSARGKPTLSALWLSGYANK